MILHNCEQRTDEWRALRIGRITGTSFATMANGKPATIETLCYKTAAEKITGVSCEKEYVNPAMEEGIALEAQGIAAYEFQTESIVTPVGFIEHDEDFGVSPDGFIGSHGGIELKCPQPHTHLKYLKDSQKAWRQYKWQVQGFLYVTKRDWIDFVSYCPSFPPESRLLIIKVLPDTGMFQDIGVGMDDCRRRIKEIMNSVNISS